MAWEWGCCLQQKGDRKYEGLEIMNLISFKLGCLGLIAEEQVCFPMFRLQVGSCVSAGRQ